MLLQIILHLCKLVRSLAEEIEFEKPEGSEVNLSVFTMLNVSWNFLIK